MSDMQDLDATLTELEGDVANVEAGEASAVALINGLSDKIDQLIASAPDTSTAIARVQTFMSRVRASNQSLADAVMANPVPA